MSISQMQKLRRQEISCFPNVTQLARAEPGFEPHSADTEAQVLTCAPHAGREGLSPWGEGQGLPLPTHLPPAGPGPGSRLFHYLLHPAVLWNRCLLRPGDPQAARAQRHQGLPLAPALGVSQACPPAAVPFPSRLVKLP